MPNRRSFLASLATAPAAACATLAAQPSPRGGWDFSWLSALRGRHKQVFAIGALTGHTPLHVVTNYFDAHRDVFGLEPPDVNAVVGIIGRSFPINASDALWAKYELGRRWELKDPKTGEWATRNVYLDGMPAPAGKVVGVRPLQARGAVFWMCNNALGGVTERLAKETGWPPDAVRAELLAGLNPGVKLVPAHTMMLGLAQEQGFTYEQVG
ncbi:MAG: hypothetical protein ACXWLM_09195 [Myxococcales bacterium]